MLNPDWPKDKQRRMLELDTQLWLSKGNVVKTIPSKDDNEPSWDPEPSKQKMLGNLS